LFLLLVLLLGAVGGGSFLFARETGFRPPVAAAPSAPAAPAAVAHSAEATPEPAASDPSAMPLEIVPAVKPVLQQRPRAAAAKAGDSDSSATKKTKKKSDDDVDLRNPYR
jgi:hypothetical protein